MSGAIDWADIIGMRHKIAHDYLYVDNEIVWAVLEHDMESLKRQLINLLKQEDK